MKKEKILVIGACGQIGVELTLALRNIYGNSNVIASDLREEHPLLDGCGPWLAADAMNKDVLQAIVRRYEVTQIYLLAAVLSATGEKKPLFGWQLNMQSLLNILEIAREEKIGKIFWPSSIAVFGPESPKKDCPQQTVIEPATVYGISKFAGESWCNYYFTRYGVDVRSLRYPGLISYKTQPGGGTTDYAVEIFHEAVEHGRYACFLKEDTILPMMYMTDAIRATIELMEAPSDKIKLRTSYNVAACSFSPKDIAATIKNHLPDFEISYQPDYRQIIADGWPQSIDDCVARSHWGWKPAYDLNRITTDMLLNIPLELTKQTAQLDFMARAE
ncbi:MAG: NAD-dependent epimerase/dehydratase family protein [Chitinophagaceae bacterium]